ncbi:hypothetical protein A3F07_04830 [candidate division WWE3 bacterium RIFCSPHIGHO2_12_FULL_38_15]|uniref:Glycosyltransferase 2-like domain-containing protein n=1 Tax=candidate division WWE3 bacterium RIFCSPHIGHO2_02_FULL_38_14 TaxID=1802620 RepID=A0A1F4VAW5_UNCKA|nr:MAG: hypothetical protein A2793_02485 [candidate division WWE3 bacterium RIFCSPHIGHO2_01_FULL_38_45]OGC48234.1 MAG: hypothetical protein A3F07_04830 [candidate division WWE3 bacterium RIFCSPHIGHO2_12_FULL_38_15]OGC53813.1 MAG: hypothetical protein A3D91_03715 [candidate division WWE3 bacterium RIFCSPHIGHO2_02_FULL_38_14]OGC54534.1 MAG: hypothetical protein A3B64_05040 [candidate division WWE3 bacterium RIFCSPLOWO2_01_FULL_37_24]
MFKRREKEGSTGNPKKIEYLIDVMSIRQKRQFYLLMAVNMAALIYFLSWWFDSSHIIKPAGMLLNSLVILWSVLLPLYFFFFVSRMKKPNPALPVPSNIKVAMVVTKAPSEPFSVVKKTLLAMISQKHVHDTWLADEDPSKETINWCKEHNVSISTRKNAPNYHNSTWPRRTKCKEGNLAYFYDNYGYKSYDVVVQMDADHIPQENYLEEMLRPFNDKEVGYVSAPSVCNANSEKSWTARARLYVESFLHGAQQAGHTNGFAPLCFGSHYAVRTSALKQIGGLGPELAEDHSTTLLMNAQGWKGVHALDAVAFGDGPASFADAMTQEFQWSRSLMVILLTLTPNKLKNLPLRIKFQFLFSQLWYPLYGVIMLIGYSIPIIALFYDSALVRIVYISFLLHSWVYTSAILISLFWLKKVGCLWPKNAKIISWEATFFQIVRWPWVFLGCFYGIVGVLRKKEFSFKVTPKGENTGSVLSFKVLIPYIILVSTGLLVSIFISDSREAAGYYYFAVLNSVLYVISIAVIILNHILESRKFKSNV